MSRNLYQEAVRAYARKLPEEATGLLKEHLETHASDVNALTLMARACQACFSDDAAEHYYKQATRHAPLTNPCWKRYARFLGERGRYTESERAWLRCLITDASSEDINIEIIKNLIYQGQHQAAFGTLANMLKSDPQNGLLLGLKNLVSYLHTGHPAFQAMMRADDKFIIRIGGYNITEEIRVLASRMNESYLFHALKQFVQPSDVCVEIGAGIGLYTLIMSNFLGAACVIPIDPRPNAQDALKLAEEKNDFFIDTQWINHAIGDGKTDIRLYPNAPLDFHPRPDARGNVPTEPLDSLPIPRVNTLVIHPRHMEACILNGAKETLKKHKPVCIIRVEATRLEAMHAYMQEINYHFKQGDYAEDGESLYCVYLPQ